MASRVLQLLEKLQKRVLHLQVGGGGLPCDSTHSTTNKHSPHFLPTSPLPSLSTTPETNQPKRLLVKYLKLELQLFLLSFPIRDSSKSSLREL